MRKVYKINGKTEVHEIFSSPSGKTKYKVTFAKGNLDPKNRVPARYTTDNAIIQDVIESSPKFNRIIFLEKVYDDVAKAEPVAAAPVKKAKAVKEPKMKVKEDVKTVADAVTVLIEEGASASAIDGTVEGALRVAKGLGISFPNLKEE